MGMSVNTKDWESYAEEMEVVKTENTVDTEVTTNTEVTTDKATTIESEVK